jgi:hypothetical protein
VSAVNAGIAAFNERNLIPSQQSTWDDYNARLSRYAVYTSYYNNDVYRALNANSARLKSSGQLYKFIRGVQNPVERLCDAYPSKVYGGSLDFEDLTTGAIPILLTNKRLIEPIRQVWIWSNWRLQKSLYVRNGTLLGDTALKIVDEPDKGKVRMEVLHPGKIKEVTRDAVGNVKAVTLEYERYNEDGTSYVYKEVWGEDQTVATFKDNQPFAYYNNANGTPIAKWDNPYGFIPLVLVQHKNVGMGWGANAFHAQVYKVDELNDAASLLNDQIRKAVNVMWYFAGVGKRDEIKTNTENRDELPAMYGPKESQPIPMIAPLDITAAGANVDRLLEELERDMPELALHRLREGGNATAPGVRAVYSDAIDRFVEAQGVYDDGLIRAQKMAISIGGFRGYDGFQGYNLDSFEAGDLEHYIQDRPVIQDMLSKEQKLQALQAANAPIWLILGELDYDQRTIDKVVAEDEERRRQAVRQFTESTFGDDDEDTDADPEDEPETEGKDQAGTNPRTPVAAR